MFRIIGDAIEYNNQTVGFLTVQPGTLRDDVVEALLESQLELDLEELKEERDEANATLDKLWGYLNETEEPEIARVIEILS